MRFKTLCAIVAAGTIGCSGASIRPLASAPAASREVEVRLPTFEATHQYGIDRMREQASRESGQTHKEVYAFLSGKDKWVKIGTRSFEDGIAVYETDLGGLQEAIRANPGTSEVHIYSVLPQSMFDQAVAQWMDSQLKLGEPFEKTMWRFFIKAAQAHMAPAIPRPSDLSSAVTINFALQKMHPQVRAFHYTVSQQGLTTYEPTPVGEFLLRKKTETEREKEIGKNYPHALLVNPEIELGNQIAAYCAHVGGKSFRIFFDEWE